MTATLRRTAVQLALGIALAASQGCTTWKGGVTGFLQNRVKDGLECLDMGVTVTRTPQFSFYLAVLSMTPIGYGKVDGMYYGVGGGDVGSCRIHYEHWGVLLYGRETVGWGNSLWDYPEFDPAKPETLNSQAVGPLGLILPPYDARPAGRPTCSKYFHFGYVGFVPNACFGQMADFALGFVGLDLAGDDGRKLGRWPWQPEDDAPAAADHPATAPAHRASQPASQAPERAPQPPRADASSRGSPPPAKPPAEPPAKAATRPLADLIP
ncbi:MAG: hypothetical protein FJ290_09045 [Planctomycetes bacterium]|nr:hypothetical protein [Planctomycetota bacterium]